MLWEWLWGDTHVQKQRRSPSKMVRGAKSHLEPNPIPARDAQRAQTNLVHTRTQRPHKDWDRTMPECLLLRYGSAVDWVQQTWVWHKPQEEVAINPTKSCENLHRTGEIDAGRAQTEPCVHQDPGERSSTPHETDPDLPVSVQETPVEAWVGGGLLHGQGHWV